MEIKARTMLLVSDEYLLAADCGPWLVVSLLQGWKHDKLLLLLLFVRYLFSLWVKSEEV